MMRLARLTLAASIAPLAFAAACLNDRPVNALGANAAIALRVEAPRSAGAANAAATPAPQQSVELSIGISCYNCARAGQAPLGTGVLFDRTYPTDSGSQRFAATFPLAPCDGYYPPDVLGTYCDVQITVTLRSDATIVAQQSLYGVRVRPGVVTQADPVTFGAFTTGLAQRGIKVEAGLVWYGMSASSVYGGIPSVLSSITDSAGCTCNSTAQFLDQAYPRISAGAPSLYSVVPGLTAMRYDAQVVDVKGNVSSPAESQGVDLPNGNVVPYVYALTSDTTVDSLRVSATGFSPLASTKQIEFVVRSVPNKFARDTIYMVCSVAAPGQFSTAAGSCPRVGPPFTAALVVAVPVDSLNGVGFGASCGLGLVCNFGTVLPQRRR